MLVKIHPLTPRRQTAVLLRAVADAVEYASPVANAQAAEARLIADREALKVAISQATPPGMLFLSLLETPRGIDATYHPAGRVHHLRYVHFVIDERDALSIRHHSTVRVLQDWRMRDTEEVIRVMRVVIPRS